MSRNPICQEEPPRELAYFDTIGCPLRDSAVDCTASDEMIVGALPVNRPRRLTNRAMTSQARLRTFMVAPSPMAPDRQGGRLEGIVTVTDPAVITRYEGM